MSEVVAAEDAVFEQIFVDFAGGLGTAQGKLMEERLGEAQTEAVDLAQFCGGVMRFLVAEICNLLQAGLAKRGHVNGGCQRKQTLIGADVGCGAFAFDVLFAGGEGQHVGALSAIVNGFTDETSSHFVDVGFLGGEEAEVGSAKPERNAKRLRFADDDVRAHLGGSLEHDQRGGIGNDANESALCRERLR